MCHVYRRQRPAPLPSRTAKSCNQAQLGVDGLDVTHARSVGPLGCGGTSPANLHVACVVSNRYRRRKIHDYEGSGSPRSRKRHRRHRPAPRALPRGGAGHVVCHPRRWRHHGPVLDPRAGRVRAMDARRYDDGRRQHVRQRAQGARRCAVQRVGPTACHHLGVSQFPSANWWPANLGVPSSVGGQNTVRYAIFPSTRRLAIQINGVTKVFDTGEHHIGGVQQQQQGSGYASVSFTSQLGTFDVSSLTELGTQRVAETPAAAPAPQYQSQHQSGPTPHFAPQTQDPPRSTSPSTSPTRHGTSHLRRRHPSLLPPRPG